MVKNNNLSRKEARYNNTHIHDIIEAKERTLRQMDINRRRRELWKEGYAFGVKGEDLDNIKEYCEINGEKIYKANDSGFLAGYWTGLKSFESKNGEEIIHKKR